MYFSKVVNYQSFACGTVVAIFLSVRNCSRNKVVSYFANPLTDYSPQLETGGSAPRMAGRSTSPVFGEDEELELASEFLEIANERDLDHFIGELMDRASSALDFGP